MESLFHQVEGACADDFNTVYKKISEETKGFLVVQCPCCKSDKTRAYWRQFGFAKLQVGDR